MTKLKQELNYFTLTYNKIVHHSHLAGKSFLTLSQYEELHFYLPDWNIPFFSDEV